MPGGKTKLRPMKRSRNKITWAKGHSSDSNPKTMKFRNLASKSRYGGVENFEEQMENKTTRKLLKRDQSMLEKLSLNDDIEENNNDNATVVSSTETAETKFSHFTNCTNPTFSKVHRLWKSGSNLQNDVLSVLAAITEIIKKTSARETEVEYFAALITFMSKDGQSTQTLAATAYLLSLVIKKIPSSILISRFSQISQSLYLPLTQCLESQNENNKQSTTLLRYLLISLGVLLKVQPRTVWESSSTAAILDGVLNFAVDSRPTVRKTAQKIISDLAMSSENHPTTKLCAKFCVETLQRCGGGGKNNTNATNTTTFYLLQLLQQCQHRFNSSSLKSTVECLLKLLTLASPLIAASIFNCFYALFLHRPSDSTLNGETDGQIILALFDFEPAKNDLKLRVNWLKTVTEATVCLADKNAQLCANTFLPMTLENFFKSLPTSNQTDVVSTTITSIKRLLTDCYDDLCKLDVCNEKLTQKTIFLLQNLLNYQYFNVWPRCFEIIVTFFDVYQSFKKYDDSFKLLLRSMAELRESENFAYKNDLEKVIGSAVKYLGPEIVLDSIPLPINADAPVISVNFPNSWLIPLLHKNVEKSNLKHYIDVFLPLAIKLKKRVDQFESEGRTVDAHVFDVVQQQLWDLLPSYCNKAVDLKESFKEIAKILGAVLLERPPLRLTVLSSLRTLVVKNASVNEENKQELSKYSKNFLPILINLYVSEVSEEILQNGYDERGVRLATLETIRIYLSITPLDLVETFLNVAIGKLNDTDEPASRKYRICDVLIALTKYLNGQQTSKLFNVVSFYCNRQNNLDKTLEKKSYRIFEEICHRCDGDFLNSGDFQSLIELLVNDFSKLTSPATKSARLKCFLNLLDNSTVDLSVIKLILPDAVLCLKENNVKTRRCAAKLLITTANYVLEKIKNVDEATKFVWNQLDAFFTDDKTQQVSCALIAARLFVFEFKNDLPPNLISYFLSQICRLLIDERRPIVENCLEFLKTFISCASLVTVGQYLDIFTPRLLAQNDDCRRHFRFLTRKVLAKLIKKFSFEVIRKFATTDEHLKQLKYIRKMLQNQENRRKIDGKSKETKENDEISVVSGPETIADLLKDTDDEESEPDDEKNDTRSRRSRFSSKTASVFLENDDENDILDLLDKKTSSKIVTKEMLSKKKQRNIASKPADHGFKTNKEGKLIVDDEENEEIILKKKSQEEKLPEETSEEKLLQPLGKRRRRESFASLASEKEKRHKRNDDEMEDVETTFSYKPGGKGIHRAVNDSNKSAGEQFKAKKGKGDVKKGKVDPYAYIPLDYRALNKRKRAKASGIYKNLVYGAKKGATKGSERRRRKGKQSK